MPTIGDTATCAACGAAIVYKDPYWDHVGENKPRHIAQPTVAPKGGHTPGPWAWVYVPRFKDIRLENTAGLVVMDFVRWGMQGAQPRFRGVHDVMFETSDLIGSDVWPHADARLLASAPNLADALQALIDAVARVRDAEDAWMRSGHDDATAAELEDAQATLIIRENEARDLLRRILA